jgi:hypothetical protein
MYFMICITFYLIVVEKRVLETFQNNNSNNNNNEYKVFML